MMTLHRAIPLLLCQRNTGHGMCTIHLSHVRRQDKLEAGGCGVGGEKVNRNVAYERSL